MEMIANLKKLARTLEGEFYYDKTMRILYATDASVYRELPLAVAICLTSSAPISSTLPVIRRFGIQGQYQGG